MQEIETVSFGYLRHARRQRQAVRRVLKQRVIGNFDLMIVNARDARIEQEQLKRLRDEQRTARGQADRAGAAQKAAEVQKVAALPKQPAVATPAQQPAVTPRDLLLRRELFLVWA